MGKKGVVIKPYNLYYVDHNGNPFIIKKVNQSFQENKPVKTVSTVSTDLQCAIDLFNTYLTENRVQSVFSKEGTPQSKAEIGNYLRLVLEDAKVDFLKDNLELFNDLSSSEQVIVFTKGSKYIVPMLLRGIEIE